LPALLRGVINAVGGKHLDDGRYDVSINRGAEVSQILRGSAADNLLIAVSSLVFRSAVVKLAPPLGWILIRAESRAVSGLLGRCLDGLSRICRTVKDGETLLIEVGMLGLKRLALHALGSGVDDSVAYRRHRPEADRS
jgi:hypothetical protein